MTPTFPTLKKYRKKPVVVEAVQWFPGKQVVGATERCDGLVLANGVSTEIYATVETIHGRPAVVRAGDWVITEPDGIHHYPCKPDVFAAFYEEVK